jgi:hypothetical protein
MQSRTWRHGWALLLAVACGTACADLSEGPDDTTEDGGDDLGGHSDALTVFTADPLSTVGHGGFFDANGKQFEPDLNFILSAQNYYLTQLQQAASKQTLARLEKTRGRLKEATQDELLGNAFTIGWLAKENGPSKSAFVAAKSSALRDLYLQKYAKSALRRYPFGVNPKVLERLKDEGIGPTALTEQGGKAYLNECANAGVPLPPDWGSSKWIGPERVNDLFIGTDKLADRYYYPSESPRGVCMALPRYAEGSKTISLLGVICLGTDTSKACFWDNNNVPRDGITPITNFRGGSDLAGGDVCSDCHAGENPFVVHPGSPLDLGDMQRPNAWYEPLVVAGWPQNPGPTNILDPITLEAGDGSCQNCHQYGSAGRFPEASTALGGWCNAVFRNAVGLGSATKTMPLGGGSADFSAHINAINDACRDAPSEGGVDVPSDGIKEDPGFISPPIIIDPLYGCADAIAVRGVILHAKVDVFIDGVLVNSVEVQDPDEQVIDVPTLSPGQVVLATQFYNGALSDPSASVTVRDHKVDYPAGLPQPTIDPTLIYECGNVIAVRHVNGARVTVYTNDADPRTSGTASGWTNIRPGKSPFDVNDKFTAEQELCGDYSQRSDPAQIAVTAPATVPPVKLDPVQTYAGQELVHTSNLLHGAMTYLSVGGFGGVAQFSTAVSWEPNVNVSQNLGRPLQAGDVLTGMQVLCEKGPTEKTPPTTGCKELPPPRIRHPRVGDTYVVVTSAVAGARVRVTTATNEELGDGSGTIIALRRPITSADVLLVVQQIGECTSSQAYRVSVRNPDPNKKKD